MRTSLLNDIEAWVNTFAFEFEEAKSTNCFVIVRIKNFSVNALEIKALEETIRYWFKDAHWHSIDHATNGLEIWIAI